MGMWQPAVEWNEARFDPETGKKQQKKPQILVCAKIMMNGIKTKRAGMVINPDESNGKKGNANMHLNKIIDRSLEGFAILMIKKDQQHGREGHDFPNHQKGKPVLNHADKNHGKMKEEKKYPMQG
jgi:hypothetical protein